MERELHSSHGQVTRSLCRTCTRSSNSHYLSKDTWTGYEVWLPALAHSSCLLRMSAQLARGMPPLGKSSTNR